MDWRETEMTSGIETLALSEIMGRDIQIRTQTDRETVISYSEAMDDGVVFPPIRCFRDPDGIVWLADGFHRYEAAVESQTGITSIQAEVYRGTRRDALLFALKANSSHGKPLNNADKRKAVQLMLDDPEWSKMPDREIARHIGVSHPFVSKMRPQMKSGVVTVTTSIAEVKQTVPPQATIPASTTTSGDDQRADDVSRRLEGMANAASNRSTHDGHEVRSDEMQTPAIATTTSVNVPPPSIPTPDVIRSSEMRSVPQAPANQADETGLISEAPVADRSEPDVTEEPSFINHLEERDAAVSAALSRLSEVEDRLTATRNELIQAQEVIERLTTAKAGPSEYELRLERELAVMMLSNPRAAAMRDMTYGQLERETLSPIQLEMAISAVRDRLGPSGNR